MSLTSYRAAPPRDTKSEREVEYVPRADGYVAIHLGFVKASHGADRSNFTVFYDGCVCDAGKLADMGEIDSKQSTLCALATICSPFAN